MQTELATLKGLWNKAATPSAKARLLAGFGEEVRRELYRMTGDSGLLEGLGSYSEDGNGATSSQPETVSGPLRLYIVGQLEVKTLEHRIEKARRRAAKSAHKRAVKGLAKEWNRLSGFKLDWAR